MRKDKPDAVVVFIGANEGFPIEDAGGKEVKCCGADWAALYANRVRRMMNTYRRKGAARGVLDHAADAARRRRARKIGRVVNAAIDVAAAAVDDARSA